MARFRITISSGSREAMLDLVRDLNLQVLDHGIRGSDAEGFVVDALAEAQDIDALRAKDYRVEQHEDVDEAGKERQREVGQGDRYNVPPIG